LNNQITEHLKALEKAFLKQQADLTQLEDRIKERINQISNEEHNMFALEEIGSLKNQISERNLHLKETIQSLENIHKLTLEEVRGYTKHKRDEWLKLDSMMP